ncbi:polyprenyl synthetase family protein [Fulvivirga sedimenti]|uniref:Polyprenyl synthetase family protein n=1 Tax=Fulvivirga sedimenti TaxID=2879465 RepID=A0A9X1HUC9_9BACT|nr:polyprenyl synthetase family protein [Fulvivirga sedimenti]MCA6078463.1 polyprenyl synthetase family protein [Fulvivirga sedimenti]
MSRKTEKFLKLIQDTLAETSYGAEPAELYEPIEYIMSLGGKRLRPLLTLMSYSLFRDDAESVVKQALAVEVFHNFTLMHDDIMDEAPLRRGKPTVHEKWNAPTAILSGDVMLVRAYDLLLNTPTEYLSETIGAFNKCAAEVCEGQQLDMLFETRDNVQEEEYINMIRLKTAVLLGYSLELGAILSGALDSDKRALREFGTLAGIGFQLKDDLLDVYGDSNKVGKQVGGDIISNKKTYLLIKSLELANPKQLKEIKSWLSKKSFDEQEKVAAIRGIYDELGIRENTQEKIERYFEQALTRLRHIDAPMPRKASLRQFAERLIKRDY